MEIKIIRIGKFLICYLKNLKLIEFYCFLFIKVECIVGLCVVRGGSCGEQLVGVGPRLAVSSSLWGPSPQSSPSTDGRLVVQHAIGGQFVRPQQSHESFAPQSSPQHGERIVEQFVRRGRWPIVGDERSNEHQSGLDQLEPGELFVHEFVSKRRSPFASTK